jgi:Protein of unknown function (DUF1588)/Protein of unknown function (DUF1592)/Protein of unknown function (DUF1585)/Protein of unknown function (DUF1595)
MKQSKIAFSRTVWTLTALLYGFASGCVGSVAGLGQQIGSTPGAGGSGGFPKEPVAVDAVGPAVILDGKPSGLRRLTRDELVTSLTQLTGTSPLRSVFPEDLRTTHAPVLTGGVSFVAVEVEKIYELIGTFARTVAPEMLAKSGCAKTNTDQQNCLNAWVNTFGQRVLRRALRPNEIETLKSILSGATGVKTVDVERVESVLTALFFSPSFLYRTEIGVDAATAAPVRTLTQDEVASRISFLSTLGPPDEPLLAAARNGKLNEATERVQQFRRLSQTPAGSHAQAVMILEWLGANESKFATKGAKYTAGLLAGTEAGLRASAEQFIEAVLKSGDQATLRNLFVGDSYLKDPMVAQVTKIGKVGDVNTGDETSQPRAGLLLHPHVLSAHTKDNGSSPFGIGSFVRESILCQPVGSPPPGATNMTRNDPPPGLTLREDLEYRTSAGPSCIGCHAQFAPIGYAFISFDPIGRWMKQDPSGKPWSLGGQTPLYRGEDLSFSSASDLTQKLSAEPQVYGCFAQVALQWVRGRRLSDEDQPLLKRIDALAKSNGGHVPKLLEAIVEDSTFLTTVSAR